MVQITDSLLRKRAEHNEGRLSDLVEVSLHQLNIEGINKALSNLCPMLEILYLQNNLIGKLQNLRRLRNLEYLNVAVNNIACVEGLERCENLTKLDFTVNFIGHAGLLTLPRLRRNFKLAELYLTGNPCTQWAKYRDYVIGTLPHLKKLDGQEVKPSERIQAQQDLEALQQELRALAVEELREKGVEEPVLPDLEVEKIVEVDSDEETDMEKIKEENAKTAKWSAETRHADYQAEKLRERKKELREEKAKEKRDPYLKMKKEEERRRERVLEEELRTGNVKNRNEGHWNFKFDDDDKGNLVVTIGFPKFLDTSLIDIEVQPTWLRCTVRGKVIQLTLYDEIAPAKAVAARSSSTGALELTLPRVDQDKANRVKLEKENERSAAAEEQKKRISSSSSQSGLTGSVDVRNMLEAGTKSKAGPLITPLGVSSMTVQRRNDEPLREVTKNTAADFDDDDDVPPLE